MTPILPFETILDDLARKLADARGEINVRTSASHGAGVLRGCYLAGMVPQVTYNAARNRLLVLSEERLAVARLSRDLERKDAT